MTTTRKTSVEAFRFFRDHAGYVLGKRAIGAIALARAEARLAEAVEIGVASVEWGDDDLPFDQDIVSEDEARAKFESNEWTGPYYCIVRVGEEGFASLGGIVVGPRNLGDPYCRVVEADLADELEDELRQAIGDAMDAWPGYEPEARAYEIATRP